MRKWINLTEAMFGNEDEREEFLETCAFWSGEVQGNEFEDGYKSETEENLLAYAHIAQDYRDIHFQSLYRGTRGISRQKANAIVKYNHSMTFDLSESKMSSWTTNPQIAERFASKNGGVVLRYSVSDFEIFLSFADLWQKLSKDEKSKYRDIIVAAEENEVLIINPPSVTVTNYNIHPFTPDQRLRDRMNYM